MYALSHIILNKHTHELHIKTEWVVSNNVKNGMRRTKVNAPTKTKQWKLYEHSSVR